MHIFHCCFLVVFLPWSSVVCIQVLSFWRTFLWLQLFGWCPSVACFLVSLHWYHSYVKLILDMSPNFATVCPRGLLVLFVLYIPLPFWLQGCCRWYVVSPGAASCFILYFLLGVRAICVVDRRETFPTFPGSFPTVASLSDSEMSCDWYEEITPSPSFSVSLWLKFSVAIVSVISVHHVCQKMCVCRRCDVASFCGWLQCRSK